MSVHYKFKSSLDYDTVTFDGLHISVGDLKKAILQQKKIGKGFDFDLQITNAQTKEVYTDDEAFVPKNASVIVSRVPNSMSSKKSWERNDSSVALLPVVATDGTESASFDKVTKTADLVSINASEDEKIRAMMSQSTQDYDPSRYVKTKGMTGPTPPNYTCFRCGRTGHWIKQCPTNTMEVKRSTGIPRSFMVTVEGPEVPGALLTSTGQYAVPMIDHEAYKEGKKEKPPFAKEMTPEKEATPQIPEELLCMICRDLLTDAVLIPCCGNSYCDECVRQALLDSDDHECPTCHEKDISPDTLIPNRFLRTAVMNFKNETGYTKIKRSPMVIQHLPQQQQQQQQQQQPATVTDSSESELAPAEESADDRKDDAEEEEKDALVVPSPADIHEEDSKISEHSIPPGDHAGTPVRDEKVDGYSVDENGSGDAVNKGFDDGNSRDDKESPVAFSISTITTRMPQSVPWMMGAPKPRGQISAHHPDNRDHRDSRERPIHSGRKDVGHEPGSRLSRSLTHRDSSASLPPSSAVGIPPPLMHNPALRPQLMDQTHHYPPPHSAAASVAIPPPTSLTQSTYSGPPPPTLKQMPPNVMMPHAGALPPPLPHSHLMVMPPQGAPPHFPHNLRHPPPPIPQMFHGPPPLHHQSHLTHRRPMMAPPPPGPNPLVGTPQPLPPGVRPILPPPHVIPPPGDVYHNPHSRVVPYPPRPEEYYQDHRNYGERERVARDPLDAFARELEMFDYRRGEHRRSRRRSASSSRSCSSRSGYRSHTPSTRSPSRSGRSSRSRSRSASYSSRSHSTSPGYSRSHSRSPFSQRSRTGSRSRSRSRSRTKPSKYSPQVRRKSRSVSPRVVPGRRSPIPPPPAVSRRRPLDYSPNYYHNMYRGPAQATGPPPPAPPPLTHPHAMGAQYDVHRGRYMDSYRYDNYRYEEDPRYGARDPRYDYLRYEDYYHGAVASAPPPRTARQWPPQVKTEDHRVLPQPRMPRDNLPPARRGGPIHPRSRSPVVTSDKEQSGSRERDRDRNVRAGSRRVEQRGERGTKNYNRERDREDTERNRDESRRSRDRERDRETSDRGREGRENRENKDPSRNTSDSSVKGSRRQRRSHETSDKEKTSHAESTSKKSDDDHDKAASVSSCSEKFKDSRHKRKAHHHSKSESPTKKTKTSSKKGSKGDIGSSEVDGSPRGSKSSKKKKSKKGKSDGEGATSEDALSERSKTNSDKERKTVKDDKKSLTQTDSLPVDKESKMEQDDSISVDSKIELDTKERFFEADGTKTPDDYHTKDRSLKDIDYAKDDVNSGHVEAFYPEDALTLELTVDLKQETLLESVVGPLSKESEDPAEGTNAVSWERPSGLRDAGPELESEEAEDNEEEGDQTLDGSLEPADENVLTAPVPELSKWELDDANPPDEDVGSNSEYSQQQQRLKTKGDGKQRGLPPDIVQRAEKAILQKAMKAIQSPDPGKSGRKAEAHRSDIKVEVTAPGSSSSKEELGSEPESNRRVTEKVAAEPAAKESPPAGRERVRLDRSKFGDRKDRGDDGSSGGSGSASHSRGRQTKDEIKERRSDSRQRDSSSRPRSESSSNRGRSTGHDSTSRRSREDSADQSTRSSRPTSDSRYRSRQDDVKKMQKSPERASSSTKRSPERSRGRDRGRQEHSEGRDKSSRELSRSDRPSERSSSSRTGRGDRDSRKEDDRSSSHRRDAESKTAVAAARDRAGSRSPDDRKSANKRRPESDVGNEDCKQESRPAEFKKCKDASEPDDQRHPPIRLDRRSSTIDESKFEPDYDDTDESTVAGGTKYSTSQSPAKERGPSSAAVSVKRRSTSSSSSSSRSRSSSPDSSSPTPKKRKSSPSSGTEKSGGSKHKKGKHKKHKKHKHKHKKKKSKKEKEDDNDSKEMKSSVGRH